MMQCLLSVAHVAGTEPLLLRLAPLLQWQTAPTATLHTTTHHCHCHLVSDSGGIIILAAFLLSSSWRDGHTEITQLHTHTTDITTTCIHCLDHHSFCCEFTLDVAMRVDVSHAGCDLLSET